MSSTIQCADCERVVDSFIDCELAEPERHEVEVHLGECAACRDLVKEQAGFKGLLRAVGPRDAAPLALRQRLATELSTLAAQTEARNQATPFFRSRWGRITQVLALAVPLVFLASPTLFFGRNRGEGKDGRYLADGRLGVFEDSISKHQRDWPLDVTGAPEKVQSWLVGKVPFAVRTPHLEPVASLRGGRLVNLGDREAVYLIYDYGRLGKLSVFVFDAQNLALESLRRETIGHREVYLEGQRGYRVAIFRDNGVGYAITGAMDESDLLRLISTAVERR